MALGKPLPFFEVPAEAIERRKEREITAKKREEKNKNALKKIQPKLQVPAKPLGPLDSNSVAARRLAMKKVGTSTGFSNIAPNGSTSNENLFETDFTSDFSNNETLESDIPAHTAHSAPVQSVQTGFDPWGFGGGFASDLGTGSGLGSGDGIGGGRQVQPRSGSGVSDFSGFGSDGFDAFGDEPPPYSSSKSIVATPQSVPQNVPQNVPQMSQADSLFDWNDSSTVSAPAFTSPAPPAPPAHRTAPQPTISHASNIIARGGSAALPTTKVSSSYPKPPPKPPAASKPQSNPNPPSSYVNPPSHQSNLPYQSNPPSARLADDPFGSNRSSSQSEIGFNSFNSPKSPSNNPNSQYNQTNQTNQTNQNTSNQNHKNAIFDFDYVSTPSAKPVEVRTRPVSLHVLTPQSQIPQNSSIINSSNHANSAYSVKSGSGVTSVGSLQTLQSPSKLQRGSSVPLLPSHEVNLFDTTPGPPEIDFLSLETPVEVGSGSSKSVISRQQADHVLAMFDSGSSKSVGLGSGGYSPAPVSNVMSSSCPDLTKGIRTPQQQMQQQKLLDLVAGLSTGSSSVPSGGLGLGGVGYMGAVGGMGGMGGKGGLNGMGGSGSSPRSLHNSSMGVIGTHGISSPKVV